MNFYDTLHASWVAQCIHAFGHELPINAIYMGAVGFELNDADEPLQHRNGSSARGFRMSYEYTELLYEPTSIN